MDVEKIVEALIANPALAQWFFDADQRRMQQNQQHYVPTSLPQVDPEAAAECWAKLRAPFPANQVGKLPRVWCASCRSSRTKNCAEHPKKRCPACKNNITTAHMDLDYVGHAAVTDRLLSVDPTWYWEPHSRDEQGLPAFDRHGALWIELYLPKLGAHKHGYGHAGDKTGPDAVKEVIGDAIRNAAMRFGVALDLWTKEDLTNDPAPAPAARRTTPGGSVIAAVADPVERDWVKEAAGCKTEAEITQLAREATEAGDFTVGSAVYKALVARKRELAGKSGEAAG